jgi:hypothetical protein
MEKGLIMLARSRVVAGGFAVVYLAVLSGCAGVVPAGGGSGAAQITADFDLSGGLGTFETQAGVPAETRGTGNFDIGGAEASSGSVEVDPSIITVTPAAGPAKSNVAMQAGDPLIITVAIAPTDELDTVCDTGEQYGPFIVVLDENYVPVSIDPSSVTLTQNTLDLINVGEFSICLRVESPVDGTVTIESLRFTLR